MAFKGSPTAILQEVNMSIIGRILILRSVRRIASLALLVVGLGALHVPVEGQLGGCHDCHYPDPHHGCVQCVLYTIVGFDSCSQPSCDQCTLGAWCTSDGFAAFLGELPEAEWLPRTVQALQIHDRSSPDSGGLVTELEEWKPGQDLRRIRNALAELGLFVSTQLEVETCEGEVVGSLGTLAAMVRAPGVTGEATRLAAER